MPVSEKTLRTIVVASAMAIFLSACLYLPEPSDGVKREAEIEIFFQKWQGTAYQYGGNNGGGIDCSALMVEAYNDLFDTNLPRTTEDQSTLGKRVRKRNLVSGDLVFFKTGLVRRHVGLYLKDGIFVHTSSSNGVIKSSLDSVYWAGRFWKAKRVLK